MVHDEGRTKRTFIAGRDVAGELEFNGECIEAICAAVAHFRDDFRESSLRAQPPPTDKQVSDSSWFNYNSKNPKLTLPVLARYREADAVFR